MKVDQRFRFDDPKQLFVFADSYVPPPPGLPVEKPLSPALSIHSTTDLNSLSSADYTQKYYSTTTSSSQQQQQQDQNDNNSPTSTSAALKSAYFAEFEKKPPTMADLPRLILIFSEIVLKKLTTEQGEQQQPFVVDNIRCVCVLWVCFGMCLSCMICLSVLSGIRCDQPLVTFLYDPLFRSLLNDCGSAATQQQEEQELPTNRDTTAELLFRAIVDGLRENPLLEYDNTSFTQQADHTHPCEVFWLAGAPRAATAGHCR